MNFFLLSAVQIDSACDKLSNLRSEVLRAIQTDQPWEVLEPLLFGYYYSFTSISSRVRFIAPTTSFMSLLNKKVDPSKGVAFAFSYADPLLDDPREKGGVKRSSSGPRTYASESFVAAADGEYERASILFNIASSMSQEAVRRKNSDPEKGLVAAMKLFKEAAGVLRYIATDPKLCLAGQRNTKDISGPTCDFLAYFLLGQAQVCFFEKAAQAKLSPPTVAKLASGAAYLFFQASSISSRSPGLSSYLRSCSQPWEAVASFQYLCLRTAANWWWSKPLPEQRMYGEEVGYLRRAVSLINQSRTYDHQLWAPEHRVLLSSRDALLEAVTAKHAEASEENAKVYFKLVPEDLPEVEVIVKAEATSFEGDGGILPEAITRLHLVDPFSFLVSPEVKAEAGSIASALESQAGTLAAEHAALSDTLRRELNDLGLPASLDAVLNSQGLPADLARDIANVRGNGGSAYLARQVEHVLSAGRAAVERVEFVGTRLASEQESDSAARTQHGARWTRRPSRTLTSEYIAQVDSLTTILKQAQQNDFLLEREFKANESEINRLTGDVGKELPQASATLAGEPTVRELQASLARVGALQRERETAIEAFRAATSANPNSTSGNGSTGLDVFGAYIRDAAGRPTLLSRLSERVVAAAEPLRTLQKEQETLVENIKRQVAAFEKVKAGSQGAAVEARERALQRLNVATTLAMRLRTNLEEGARFYSELTRHNIEPLELATTDFLLAREKEYFEHIQYISGGANNYVAAEVGAPSASAPPGSVPVIPPRGSGPPPGVIGAGPQSGPYSNGSAGPYGSSSSGPYY